MLLIEDDAMVARAIGASLTSAGFDVPTIDRADAVDTIEAPQRFDVIVSDVDLPGGGGPHAVARLRERGATSAAVVFVSGYAPSDKIPARLGFRFGFVQKPFAPEQLLQAIEDQRSGPAR